MASWKTGFHQISYPVFLPSSSPSDMYGSVVGQSLKVDKTLLRLHLKIRHEITLQKQMYSLLGTLDLVFASSSF